MEDNEALSLFVDFRSIHTKKPSHQKSIFKFPFISILKKYAAITLDKLNMKDVVHVRAR